MTVPVLGPSERSQERRLLQALAHCRQLLEDLILHAADKLPTIETPERWLEATARYLGLLPEQKPRLGLKGLAAIREPLGPAEPLSPDLTLNLVTALALLPLTERQFVVLRAMHFSAEEIAERTGYHPASVRKRVRQGIARVAATLDGRPRVGHRPSRRHPSPAPTGEPPAGLFTTSARTRQSNLYHLRRFARWLGAENPEAAIVQLLGDGPQAAAEMLARFRAAMLESGLSDHTVRNRLSVLRVTVRLAAQLGLIQWQLPGTR
jgi:DNA-directed RNA polymerase specialized sigma24 family protein